LDSPSREIRILTLHAGISNEPIQGTLRNKSLLHLGQFKALSYQWGSPSEKKEILLGSHRGKGTTEYGSLHIYKNAWEVLLHIRESKGDIDIWIDGICINQENQYEKEHQLKLMPEIYSRATSVYAWLGPSTLNSITAFQMIREIRLSHKSRFHLSQDKNFKRCVRDLIDRDYWSRTWIVQEVLLAQELRLVVGSDMIDWTEVRQFLNFVIPLINRSASRQNLRAIVDHEEINQNTDMAQLLARFRLSRCRYPRDRIFGMMGLVEKSIQDAIIVDLDSSLLQVCADNMAVLLVKPSKLREEGLKAVRNHSLPPKSVWKAIVDIFGDRFAELQRLAQSASLRKQLNIDISVSAIMRWSRIRCHTFAGIPQVDHQGNSPILPLGPSYSPQHYQAFISRIDLIDVNSKGDQNWVFFNGLHPAFLYSTIHPGSGDIFLDLWSSWLIARRINGVLQIVDIAVLGATDSLSSRTEHTSSGPGIMPKNNGLRGMLNPLKWLQGRIPDRQITLTGKPQIHKRGASWDVRLNGAGLAEAARNQYLIQHMPKFPPVDWDPLALTKWSDRTSSKHGWTARCERRSKRYDLRSIRSQSYRVRKRTMPDSAKASGRYTLGTPTVQKLGPKF
jgi:hypothetical protein